MRAGLACLGWIALAVALAVVTPPARAQTPCGPRAALAAHLAETYDERPAGRGLLPDGSVIELFAAPAGSWTLIVSTADGLSCLAATGEAWQSLPPAAAPKPES